jgi:hypothetical protein
MQLSFAQDAFLEANGLLAKHGIEKDRVEEAGVTR